MYDGDKIVAGIVIFLILMTFPLWYNASMGKTGYIPKPKIEPKILAEKKQCIEPKEYIRVKHMDLLKDWRESVVRRNIRVYEASDKKKYNMSLTKTCINCHSNKRDEFCNQCHNYMGVTNNCWDCHTHPKEISPKGT
jgi:Zn-dependent metalloprotease